MTLCHRCRVAQHTAFYALDPLEVTLIHRGAAGLRRQGDRPSAEAWVEVAQGPMGPAAVIDLLDRFGRLTHAQLVAAGGDRPLPRVLHLVPR